MARYRKHTIAYGDTLQHIAQEYLGDVTQWEIIVAYNKLEYPYIVPNNSEKLQNVEGLVTIGDTIIIPVEQNLLDVDTKTLNRQEQETILSLALGRDLNTIADTAYYETYGGHTEILGLSSNHKGDLETVGGVDNLKQALIKRLLTPMGSLLFHPNYGSNLSTMLGKRASYGMVTILDNEIMSTIKKDGRVESVTKKESYIDGDAFYGEYDVMLYSIDDYFKLIINADGEDIILQ